MKKKSLIISLFLCLGIGVAQAQFTNLWSFNAAKDTNGASPYGSLILLNNKLYGMTYSGGIHGVGNVFSIQTDGANYKNLWSFNQANDSNGASPYGSLLSLAGRLYGMTYAGGVNGDGTIFSIDTNGANYKDLFDFAGSNGANPQGSLVVAHGVLYGMTTYGGLNTYGTIFRIDTNGANFNKLWDFNVSSDTNGVYPYGSLTPVGGKLYGMTLSGGLDIDGLLFSIDTNGNGYKDLLDFTGTNGLRPYGDLTSLGAKLYGMTSGGGVNYDGNIFLVDTDGTNYKDLVDFTTAKGQGPYGSLTLSGNLFYGMTEVGGSVYNEGDIFSVDTNGSGYTNLYGFNISNGSTPMGNVLLSEGVLYGMTSAGGADNYGIVFGDAVCNLLSLKSTSKGDTGSSSGVATITASGGPTPYTYLWTPGGETASSISGLSAGTYTCTVTDKNGCQKVSEVVIKLTTGINNIRANAAQIKPYPNPNDGIFTMEIGGGQLATDNENTQVEIYNELGQKIYTTQLSGVNSPLSINLSSQPGGVYLYRVITGSGSLMGEGKLVIQK